MLTGIIGYLVYAWGLHHGHQQPLVC